MAMEKIQGTTCKCMMCGEWIDIGELCDDCEAQEITEKREVNELMQKGHPYHCASRQVYGDGECECHLYKKGYDPYAWANT